MDNKKKCNGEQKVNQFSHNFTREIERRGKKKHRNIKINEYNFLLK